MLPVNPCWFPTSAVLYSTGPQPNFIIIIGSRMFSGDTVFIFIYFTYNPLKVSSVLLLMTGSPPFSWLNNISLCVLTSSSSSIHPLTGTYTVSISWLLWIRLQWIRECEFIFQILVLFPSDICPRVELPKRIMWYLYFFSFLRHPWAVFHSGCTNLHSHQWCTRAPTSSYLHKH